MSCMSVANPDKLCLGAFLHFEKYESPAVRDYYNNMVLNIVKGLGVQMHRVNNAENLKLLHNSIHMTHLFIAEEEYNDNVKLIEELAKLGREDIMVFAGGVIPAQDYDFLYRAGVMGIFGPGTSVAKAACDIMEILLDKEDEE